MQGFICILCLLCEQYVYNVLKIYIFSTNIRIRGYILRHNRLFSHPDAASYVRNTSGDSSSPTILAQNALNRVNPGAVLIEAMLLSSGSIGMVRVKRCWSQYKTTSLS